MTSSKRKQLKQMTVNLVYISRVDVAVNLVPGPYTEGGGEAAGAVAPQRKFNLQFLFYFKYIGQDKSCLIFKYIGALSSFAPLAKKSCVRPCLEHWMTYKFYSLRDDLRITGY